MSQLAGKHAVVTGGGRGIGASIAATLVREGATVSVLGRDAGRLAAQVAALGGEAKAQAVGVDVTDEASVHGAFASIHERFARVDILVNNAGQAKSAPFARTDLALWRRLIDVNLTGTFLCTREVLPEMTKRGGGRIVNVASTAGLLGYAYVSAYCAAKHGVIGLTRAVALEAAKSGVTVNAVCPGYTETEIVVDAVANIVAKTGKSEVDARAALVARNPQGRMIQPEEVANAVVWLCLPSSGSITGQAIAIAGGEVM
ncbi:MAG TPA: SDR family NAD(P)-dependent oxidoreductase [Burkholderiales bacterium]|nr:SDR family NAD(P)-dependent oxidoreductase [Burkholderiales bacterium]